MSSSRRVFAAGLLAALVTLPLAACTGVGPVYQYGAADAERMAVQFASPNNRLELIIYNELKLRFRQGGSDAPRVSISARQANRSLTNNTVSSPVSQYQATVTASLRVTDPVGKTLGSASRSATADYTTSAQVLAAREAADEAGRRAARAIADTLRLEILAALSK